MMKSERIRFWTLSFFFSSLWLITNSTTSYAQQYDRNANLKAVFIYNFTMYFDWEDGASNNDFIIGILGSSPVKNPLQQIATTKDVNGRKIMVKSFENTNEINTCDILFIPHGSRIPLSSVLERVPPGTLTISESPGHAEAGACLNFIVTDERLKFEANLDALARAGLKASSQLLKLANIVRDK